MTDGATWKLKLTRVIYPKNIKAASPQLFSPGGWGWGWGGIAIERKDLGELFFECVIFWFIFNAGGCSSSGLILLCA